MGFESSTIQKATDPNESGVETDLSHLFSGLSSIKLPNQTHWHN